MIRTPVILATQEDIAAFRLEIENETIERCAKVCEPYTKADNGHAAWACIKAILELKREA